jgi:hypothetical protein
MNVEKVRSLLKDALDLLDSEAGQPLAQEEELPAKIELHGKVGRPELKKPQDILLWEAGFKISGENGESRWTNIQAWRKTAHWASENLKSGDNALAVGRWKFEEWRGDDGEQRSREVFVADHFKPVYDSRHGSPG